MHDTHGQTKSTLDRIFTGCLTTIYVTVICTLIGYFIITRLIIEGLFTPWTYLGSTPEPAEKILSAHIWYLAVQTASGSIYELWTNDSANHWEKVDAAMPLDPQLKKFAPQLARPFPKKIKDQIAFSYYPESVFDVRYVIAEDGSVYRWMGTGGYSAIFYGVLAGFFGGLCIGGFIGIFLALK